MTESVLLVEGLTKHYGTFAAVKGISFSVKKGEIFAFLGPNGAGKTTTIKMLTTLLSPTSGKMLVNTFDPMHQQNDVRRSLGIVFQDPSLDDELTAYENLEFHGVLYSVPKNIRKTRIKELLNFVELWDRKDDFVKHFSGGMKRRLEIARAILHHPKIIFLDEPTIGLDPQTRNHIWTYLKELSNNEGITVFFTTHHMEEADRVANRIAIIDHGKIIAQGTPNNLKKQTKKDTLEDAFIALTGHDIRAQGATGTDALRAQAKLWGRK